MEGRRGMAKFIVDKNKRAGVLGTTLTWFVGVLIVFFIIMVFIVATTVLAGVKKVSFEGEGIILEESSSEVLEIQRKLVNVLNNEIEFNGEKQEVLDAVFSSLDVYFDTESEILGVGSLIEKYGVDNYNDISRVDRVDMIQDGFDGDVIAEIGKVNQNFGNELKEILKLHCDEFFLSIPQGVITEKGFQSPLVLDENVFYDSEEMLVSWTQILIYDFVYRGQVFKIKYRVLREC